MDDEDTEGFNLNDRLKDYKRQWKECLEILSHLGLVKKYGRTSLIGHRCVGTLKKRAGWLPKTKQAASCPYVVT